MAPLSSGSRRTGHGGYTEPVLGTVLGVVVAVGVIGVLVAIQRHRVRRAVSTHAEAWFAGAVAASPGSLGTRILVVDADGLGLCRTSGNYTQHWSWADVQAVRADRIRHRAGLTWPGLVVTLDSRWEPELKLIVDPASGGGPAQTRAAAAVAAIERGISQGAAGDRSTERA